MTPKEKAKELIKKYEIEFLSFGDYLPTFKAKQCALIAVDEMLNYFSKETFMMAYPEIAIIEVQYWEEVKKIIEAL